MSNVDQCNQRSLVGLFKAVEQSKTSSVNSAQVLVDLAGFIHRLNLQTRFKAEVDYMLPLIDGAFVSMYASLRKDKVTAATFVAMYTSELGIVMDTAAAQTILGASGGHPCFSVGVGWTVGE